MKPKHFTVMVIPQGRSRVKEFSVHYRSLWMLLAGVSLLAGLLVGLLVFYSVGYHLKKVREVELQKMECERDTLVAQIQGMDRALGVLRGNLDDLAEQSHRLCLLADLPQVDPEVRQVGIEREAYADTSRRGGTSRSLGLIGRIRADLDRLLRQGEMEREVFEEIERKLTHDQKLRDHTPSIRPCRGGYLGSGFGIRRDPFTGRLQMHEGVDILGHHGSPIYATADGRVAEVVTGEGGFGWMVRVDHQYGYETVYAHLSKTLVQEGDRVRRGEKIGEMGNTGRSTGTHLHYEVHQRGQAANPWYYILEEDDRTASMGEM